MEWQGTICQEFDTLRLNVNLDIVCFSAWLSPAHLERNQRCACGMRVCVMRECVTCVTCVACVALYQVMIQQ